MFSHVLQVYRSVLLKNSPTEITSDNTNATQDVEMTDGGKFVKITCCFKTFIQMGLKELMDSVKTIIIVASIYKKENISILFYINLLNATALK